MKKALLLFLVIFIFKSQAQDLNSKIPIDDKVTIGKLENGLTYYIRKNSRPENKVELRLVVNAGSILETDEQRGLAHFMEHMNFNGTKNFEHNDLVDYLQSIGVKFGQHLNAYTSFDETVYILPIPSEDGSKVEKGFEILEDWAFNNLLEPEEIDKERGVVLEELRLGLGANQRMRDKYFPLLMYQSQYAERLPIGLKSVIENFDHKELKDFYKTWYRPDLMAIVVVGDIDVSEMEKKIKSHFASYSNPDPTKERKEYDVPDHKETFIAIESDEEAAFTQVQMLYKQKGASKPNETVGDYRDDLVNMLFNTMINSRLSELANSNNPPFTYGASYYGNGYGRNKKMYQSFAMTEPSKQLNSFSVLVEENERVKRYGFVNSEFERAKKEILSRLDAQEKNKEKIESRRYTREYVSNFLDGEVIPGIEWEAMMANELIKEIALSEVNSKINEFIHEDNRVVIFTGPDSGEETGITKTSVLEILDDVKTKDLEPYKEDVVPTEMMVKIPVSGSISSKDDLSELELKKIVLNNGVSVYYKKTDFNDNQILLRAFSPGGLSTIESDEEYKKVSLAMNNLGAAGLNSYSQNEMDKIMAGKNVRLSPFVSDNYEGFNGSSTNDDIELLFQMIYLNFTALNKDEEAYLAEVEKQVGFMENLKNTPQYWFMNEVSKKTEKNNPRFIGFPTREDYEFSDYNLAYSVFKDRFSDASDFSFVIVGSIDEEVIENLSKTYLASLPSTGREETFVYRPYEHLKGKHEFVLKKGQDPKSMVQINYRTEAEYNSDEAHYLKTLGEILTIKLTENLREDQSGVYGVGARGSASKYPVGVYNFSISFPCGPENVEKLKTAALEELNKILKDGPSKKDIEKVREAQLLELEQQLKENRFWLTKINTMIYYNDGFNDMTSMDKRIKEMKIKDIKTAAQKYILDDVVISVLMPE